MLHRSSINADVSRSVSDILLFYSADGGQSQLMEVKVSWWRLKTADKAESNCSIVALFPTTVNVVVHKCLHSVKTDVMHSQWSFGSLVLFMLGPPNFCMKADLDNTYGWWWWRWCRTKVAKTQLIFKVEPQDVAW